MNFPVANLFNEIEYVWQVGDPIATVGLWRRDGDTEFPVYQNTRGREIWNAADAETSNVDQYEPTEAFWRAISEFHTGREIDVSDCEWYEREALDSLAHMLANHELEELPDEIGELLGYADSRAGGDGE